MDKFILNLDRPLPCATDMERAVLGSLLQSNRAFFRVAAILDVEDFYRESNREIYRAIAALARRGDPVDLLTVKEELVRNGEIGTAGGGAYIASLVDGIPDVTNVERYARSVAEKGQLRRIINVCNDGMRRALEAEESPAMLSSEITTTLSQLTAIGDRESRPLYDVALEVDRRIHERANEGRTRVIATGFKDLDYHRVVRRKALIVVGAPTSHGKTTFMLNLAVGAAEVCSINVALYSLEMSDEDVVDPVRSMVSGVRLQNIQDRNLDAWERKRIEEADDWLKQRRYTLFFADRIRDIDTLYADCRKRKITRGLDLVLIDYLQLVKGFDERMREQEVDKIARQLLLMSQELDCAVVTGSQVNKERQKRASGRLSVEDLKHGAVIGEHARVVLMFQRPRQDDKSNGDIPWCRTTFQIEKNSGRRTGDVPMHADLSVQRFAEGSCEDNNCRRAKGVGKEPALFASGGNA